LEVTFYWQHFYNLYHYLFYCLLQKKARLSGPESGDTNLITTVYYKGEPTLIQQDDGFHGKLLAVKANYINEPLNWNIMASANKANFLTFTFKPEPDLMFYARVNVLSKKKKLN